MRGWECLHHSRVHSFPSPMYASSTSWTPRSADPGTCESLLPVGGQPPAGQPAGHGEPVQADRRGRPPMLRFFVRRVLIALLTLFAVSVTTFLLFFAVPADPAATMCGTRICPVDQAARIRASLGLDRPLVVQYGEYMRGVFAGRVIGSGSDKIDCPAPCLGVSFRNHRPVLT